MKKTSVRSEGCFRLKINAPAHHRSADFVLGGKGPRLLV
jgi:hypothetical protein